MPLTRNVTALKDHDPSMNDSLPVGNRFFGLIGNETRPDLGLKSMDSTFRSRRAVFASLRLKYHLSEVAITRPYMLDR